MARKTPEYKKSGITQAAFKAMIKNSLRNKSRFWKPKQQAKKDAFIGMRINKKSGRKAKHYRCAICGEAFPDKHIELDHIEPVVGEKGFQTWDIYIDRMFCDADGYQCLCKECHLHKTNKERKSNK